jgi:hypothetical protein
LHVTSNDTEPAKGKILAKALHALRSRNYPSEQPGLTISDICDLTGFKDGFVRDRLNELVEEGHLHCEPGAGRRPSFYMHFCPVEFMEHKNIDERPKGYKTVLDDIERKEKILREHIDALTTELEQLATVKTTLFSLEKEFYTS